MPLWSGVASVKVCVAGVRQRNASDRINFVPYQQIYYPLIVFRDYNKPTQSISWRWKGMRILLNKKCFNSEEISIIAGTIMLVAGNWMCPPVEDRFYHFNIIIWSSKNSDIHEYFYEACFAIGSDDGLWKWDEWHFDYFCSGHQICCLLHPSAVSVTDCLSFYMHDNMKYKMEFITLFHCVGPRRCCKNRIWSKIQKGAKAWRDIKLLSHFLIGPHLKDTATDKIRLFNTILFSEFSKISQKESYIPLN